MDGRRIKAVVQLTKMAFAYVFDRTNGTRYGRLRNDLFLKAMFRVKDVTDAAISDEATGIRPAGHERRRRDRLHAADEGNGAEGNRRLSSGACFHAAVLVDAAKGTKGTLTFPGSGGANWEGGAFDPETGFLYVASATRTDTAVYGVTRPEPGQTDLPMIGTGERWAERSGFADCEAAMGTDHRDRSEQWAIQAWQIVNGDTPPEVKNHPLLRGVTLPKTGSPTRAGILVTKTLLFAGEGYQGQPFFRAYDKKTGATLWETQTPVGPQTGLPMTYSHRGKQYIAFTVEGDAASRTAAQLVAYVLP